MCALIKNKITEVSLGMNEELPYKEFVLQAEGRRFS
jgi:hypothetical protein